MWEILLACVNFISWTCQNFVGISMDKFVGMEKFMGMKFWLWKIFFWVCGVSSWKNLWLWFWTCRDFFFFFLGAWSCRKFFFWWLLWKCRNFFMAILNIDGYFEHVGIFWWLFWTWKFLLLVMAKFWWDIDFWSWEIFVMEWDFCFCCWHGIFSSWNEIFVGMWFWTCNDWLNFCVAEPQESR